MGSYCFAVPVKIKEGGVFFITYPKPTINLNSLLDLDGIIGYIRGGKSEYPAYKYLIIIKLCNTLIEVTY